LAHVSDNPQSILIAKYIFVETNTEIVKEKGLVRYILIYFDRYFICANNWHLLEDLYLQNRANYLLYQIFWRCAI